MAFALQFLIEQCVAHFENQIPQPTIITVQNGTGDIGWSGDAHTLATTVNRDRGESETGCWRASTRLAACAVALLSPRRPVAGLIKQTGLVQIVSLISFSAAPLFLWPRRVCVHALCGKFTRRVSQCTFEICSF